MIEGLRYRPISKTCARSMLRLHLIGLMLFLTGCAQTVMLPPTIYAAAEAEVFGEIEDALASRVIDVAYFTDRQAETSKSGQFGYGIGRSQSLAFGTARVEIGKDLSWNDVDAYSRGDGQRPTLNPVDIEATGRFPATPYLLDIEIDGRPQPVPEIAAELRKAEAEARVLIKAQLDRADVKEVFRLVHGVANDFEDAVFGAAEDGTSRVAAA